MSDTSGAVPAEPKPDPHTRETFFAEIQDAALLLEFAVAHGTTLDTNLIVGVKQSQEFLAPGAPWPGDKERAAFETAYRDLARAMQPVTAASLKATQYVRWQGSAATRFCWRLYSIVGVCVIAVLVDPALQSDDVTKRYISAVTIHSVVPYVYGLVGALTYLLRKAQGYLSDRTFDLYYRSEYYNRMVLGFLAGGIVDVLAVQSGTGLKTSAALSFLVGYNTDYLFQLIERVAKALFPSDSTPAAALSGLTLVKDSLKAGEGGNCTLTLNGKAGSGGVTVALSADPGLTLASTSATVAEGTTSATFSFKVDAALPAGVVTGSKLHIIAKQDGNSVTAAVTLA
jgi:hypothetical protein